ncbi:unnamed protein product [Zymoseptoria tritici ST99CH_1E4]|uniref:Uncharacterized protein n=1 Tax=Zymoseptoria tritici ST99CH_1E4 TaxID=1276532 RepID=A0A2H1GIZ8_ZYMTR|nr:unnamed protein product [Zymoseptoria tritici ST99CH_1E4]
MIVCLQSIVSSSKLSRDGNEKRMDTSHALKAKASADDEHLSCAGDLCSRAREEAVITGSPKRIASEHESIRAGIGKSTIVDTVPPSPPSSSPTTASTTPPKSHISFLLKNNSPLFTLTTTTLTMSSSNAPIPYATIGTNWITTSWIHACNQVPESWTLHSVYSRSRSTASTFAAQHNCKTTHTSLDSLLADPILRAVYIASPNSLHFTQARQCLSAGKHVILEKPATCTSKQLDELFRLSKENNVVLIEAFRHIREHNFLHLHKLVNEDKVLGPIYGASLPYASYSSRYTNVLNGETPNIFSLDFGGGALVDVGVYPVCFAVALFGTPKSQSYTPTICATGVDAAGVGTLQYDNFGVALNVSKAYSTSSVVEIYGEKGTLRVNGTTDISSIVFVDAKSKEEKELADEGKCLKVTKPDVNMEEEVREFGRIILEGDEQARQRLEELSRAIIKVTESMRRGAGILYPADQEWGA